MPIRRAEFSSPGKRSSGSASRSDGSPEFGLPRACSPLSRRGGVPERLLAVVNPAAGGGRAKRRAAPLLERLGQLPSDLEVRYTTCAWHATRIAAEAYHDGVRAFIAVGGDGTAFEVLNGAGPLALQDQQRVSLAVLPCGTGDSWVRSFSPGPASRQQAIEQTLRCLAEGRSRKVDILRLQHRGGEHLALLHVAVGLPATIADRTNRRYKRLGEFGYLLAAIEGVLRPPHVDLDLTLLDRDGTTSVHDPVVALSLHNSALFGGALPMAPAADPTDGRIDIVRVAAAGSGQLLRALPGLRTGRHVNHPLVAVDLAHTVRWQGPESSGRQPVLLDGEVIQLEPSSCELLAGVIDCWI